MLITPSITPILIYGVTIWVEFRSVLFARFGRFAWRLPPDDFLLRPFLSHGGNFLPALVLLMPVDHIVFASDSTSLTAQEENRAAHAYNPAAISARVPPASCEQARWRMVPSPREHWGAAFTLSPHVY